MIGGVVTSALLELLIYPVIFVVWKDSICPLRRKCLTRIQPSAHFVSRIEQENSRPSPDAMETENDDRINAPIPGDASVWVVIISGRPGSRYCSVSSMTNYPEFDRPA